MKKTITFLTLLLCVFSVRADFKVLEKSTKKVPDWVGKSEEGFLIVNIAAESLPSAQSMALQNIYEQIVMSVASNVSVTQNSVMSEKNTNGQNESYEEYSMTSAIKGANLPFLKDITLAKAADTYWEKKLDKANGKQFYDYTVKYPYSAQERRSLIDAFEKYDFSMEKQLDNLESSLNSVGSSEEISKALTELEALQGYFFDNVRLTKANGLAKRYRDLYKGLTSYGECVSPGVIECGLKLNGRTFSVPSLSKVSSNCARILSKEGNNGVFQIRYNAEDCLSDDINTVTVTFRVGDRKIDQVIEF